MVWPNHLGGQSDSEYNIFIASSLSDPQNAGSALKPEHTLGYPGSL
jgi:hypothetical protein